MQFLLKFSICLEAKTKLKKTFKNLIAELKKILGNKLSGVHILIDSQQWVKKGQNKDDYIKDISANTQIPSSQITLTPIDYQNKLLDQC